MINQDYLFNENVNICSKIKKIYFKDKKWFECYQEVAKKFFYLKEKVSNFYNEKNQENILKTMESYSEQDIRDALD